MYLTNSTSAEDDIIADAKENQIIVKLLGILERFDNEITDKNKLIEELQAEVKDKNSQISMLESDLADAKDAAEDYKQEVVDMRNRMEL